MQEGLRAKTSRTMTYLTGKLEENKSMSLTQKSPKVWRIVRSASPVRMVSE